MDEEALLSSMKNKAVKMAQIRVSFSLRRKFKTRSPYVIPRRSLNNDSLQSAAFRGTVLEVMGKELTVDVGVDALPQLFICL